MSKFYTNLETNKQIKDNEILFIGCSHTAGTGHGVFNTVYTHIFCKALGLIPLVGAHPGKSNYLTEEKLNTYDLRNKKVIIQFTDAFRLRLNGVDITHWSGSDIYTIGHSEVFTDEVLASMFCEQAKRVVNLLRSNNCQFLFFHMTIRNDLEYKIYDNLEQYKEFCSIYKVNYVVDMADDDIHWGPKTMEYIANILLVNWRKLYDE
tara:strand:+ start:897 stop:1514 length:618 start_codon:yes stop_codon:yes gene_type:complete